MGGKSVGLRVPSDLFERLEAARAARGGTLTAIILEAIACGLDSLESNAPGNVEQRLTIVEQRLNNVEQRLTAPPIPTPGSSPKPPPPPEIPEGGDRLSDSALRRRWINAGSPGTFQQWAASQGWQRYGAGNRAVWRKTDE